MDVDILIPAQGLVVEFDGSYWHGKKFAADRKKTMVLSQAGWRVIRIRQKPLKRVTQNDIVISTKARPATVKSVVDLTVQRIQDVCGLRVRGLSRYLERKTLLSGRKAEAYIETLLAEGNSQVIRS